MTTSAPAANASLHEWLSWLEELHPTEIDLGLERVAAVAERAGLTQDLPLIVTVAGTNGKGSVVATIAAIYQSAGYTTGAYTSPHLVTFNERIQIDRQCVSDQTITAALAYVETYRHATSLTYFEATTLAAMRVFQTAGVDVAVLEVGLGGRLDAVNCWDTDCAVVTSIAIDHESWLGSDRNVIAAEKVAVARPGKPLIIAETDDLPALQQKATDNSAHVWRSGQHYRYTQPDANTVANTSPDTATAEYWTVTTPTRTHSLPVPALPGQHQFANTAAAVAAIDALAPKLPVSAEQVLTAIPDVILPGRLQAMELQGVKILLDVAHNPAAAAALASALATVKSRQSEIDTPHIHAVVAIMADKDVDEIIHPLSAHIDSWYCAQLSVERALAAEELALKLRHFGQQNVSTHASVAAALEHAVKVAQGGQLTGEQTGKQRPEHPEHHLVVVFGSFYTVSDVMSRPESD